MATSPAARATRSNKGKLSSCIVSGMFTTEADRAKLPPGETVPLGVADVKLALGIDAVHFPFHHGVY